MDWAAKLLGLAPHFLNISGTGGGVIQVCEGYCYLISYSFKSSALSTY